MTAWARQGVLLLNSSLTVRRGNAGSHAKHGWHEFTNAIISAVNRSSRRCAFLLWGKHAQERGKLVNRGKHKIFTSVHPSPLSAHRGFFGNQHFVKANAFLRETNQTEVDWRLPQYTASGGGVARTASVMPNVAGGEAGTSDGGFARTPSGTVMGHAPRTVTPAMFGRRPGQGANKKTEPTAAAAPDIGDVLGRKNDAGGGSGGPKLFAGNFDDAW